MERDQDDIVARKFKLTKSEGLIFSALMRWKMVSKDQLMTLLYGTHNDSPEPHILAVHICRMRRKGVKIKTHWGRGWSLEDPFKHRIRSL